MSPSRVGGVAAVAGALAAALMAVDSPPSTSVPTSAVEARIPAECLAHLRHQNSFGPDWRRVDRWYGVDEGPGRRSGPFGRLTWSERNWTVSSNPDYPLWTCAYARMALSGRWKVIATRWQGEFALNETPKRWDPMPFAGTGTGGLIAYGYLKARPQAPTRVDAGS